LVLENHSKPRGSSTVRLEVSAATLKPIRWTTVRHRSGGDGEGGVYGFDQSTTYTIERATGRLHTVTTEENSTGSIPTRILTQSREPEWRTIREPAAPITIGGIATLILNFQAALISDDWRGSFESWYSMLATSTPSLEQPQSWWQTSYEVDGTEVVTVPAGTFDAWVVRVYDVAGREDEIYYLRKADGLLLRTTSEWGSAGLAEMYPRGSFSLELQSVTYP
jgi:hypothetical protein